MTKHQTVRVPGTRITVWAHSRFGGEEVWTQHTGSPEDLIAAGVATAEMLDPAYWYPRGSVRIDPEGNEFHVCRGKGRRNGQPYPRLTVVRKRMLRSVALRLPGVREALAIFEEPRRASEQTQVANVPTRRVPYLRLVVDNTRGVYPSSQLLGSLSTSAAATRP